MCGIHRQGSIGRALLTGLGVMQQGERACHPTRSKGGRAGTAGRDAWDPDTGLLRETDALPYRRFMNDAAMCRNLAIRRHANADVLGDHAAATVTPAAPPVMPNAPRGRGDCFARKNRLEAATCHASYKTIQETMRPLPVAGRAPGRGDCFAKKYRLVAATCHNSYKTIQKTIRPPPWRDAEPDAPPGRGDCFAKKYRLVAAMCHNSYKTIQKTIRPPPWRDAEPDAPPGRGDCFAKKYRLVAATCCNSYKTIQKTIRPPLWRDAEPDAPPGRGDCFAKKYRLVAAMCHNSYKTIQKTIRPRPVAVRRSTLRTPR